LTNHYFPYIFNYFFYFFMITYDLLQSMINPFKSFIKTFSLKALFVIFRFKFSLIVDINCDVTSIYVKTEALNETSFLGSRPPYTLRFPRAAGGPPRADALRGPTDAFPPAGVFVYTGGWYSIC